MDYIIVSVRILYDRIDLQFAFYGYKVVICNGGWKYVSIGRNILFYLIIIFNFQKLRTSFDSYELLNFQVMKGRQRIDNFAKQKKKKEKKTLNLNIFSPLQIPQHLQHWQALSNIEPMIKMSVTSLTRMMLKRLCPI